MTRRHNGASWELVVRACPELKHIQEDAAEVLAVEGMYQEFIAAQVPACAGVGQSAAPEKFVAPWSMTERVRAADCGSEVVPPRGAAGDAGAPV